MHGTVMSIDRALQRHNTSIYTPATTPNGDGKLTSFLDRVESREWLQPCEQFYFPSG
jgi:hypothetical protein